MQSILLVHVLDSLPWVTLITCAWLPSRFCSNEHKANRYRILDDLLHA
jgi:hypothetical protein